MGLPRVRPVTFDEVNVQLVPNGRNPRSTRERTSRLRDEAEIMDVMGKDRSGVPADPDSINQKIFGMTPDVFNRCMLVYDMRLDGWSYMKIARAIYPPEEITPNKIKNIGKDVTRAMRMIAKLLEEDHKYARETEVSRLDRLYRRIAKFAHGYVEEIQLTPKELKNIKPSRYKYATEEIDLERGVLTRTYRPDIQAADTVIAISKRRSELLGIDSPKKIQFGEDPDAPFQQRKSEADLLGMLQNMAEKLPPNTSAKLGVSKTSEGEAFELEVARDGMINLAPNCPSLKRAGWNEETEVLTIETRAGKMVEFIDVPEEVFLGFIESRSQSSFYIRNIKDKFPSQAVN